MDITNRRLLVRTSVNVFLLSLAATVVIVGALAFAPSDLAGWLGFVVNGALLSAVLVTGLGFASGTALTILLLRIRVTWPTRKWLVSRVIIAGIEPFLTVPLALLAGPAGLASNAFTSNSMMTLRMAVGFDRRRETDVGLIRKLRQSRRQ